MLKSPAFMFFAFLITLLAPTGAVDSAFADNCSVTLLTEDTSGKNLQFKLKQEILLPTSYFGDPFNSIGDTGENIPKDLWKKMIRHYAGPFHSSEANEEDETSSATLHTVIAEEYLQKGILIYPQKFMQEISQRKTHKKNIDTSVAYCKLGVALPVTPLKKNLSWDSQSQVYRSVTAWVSPESAATFYTSGSTSRDDMCKNEFTVTIAASPGAELKINRKEYEHVWGDSASMLYLECVFPGKTTRPSIKEIQAVVGDYFEVSEQGDFDSTLISPQNLMRMGL